MNLEQGEGDERGSTLLNASSPGQGADLTTSIDIEKIMRGDSVVRPIEVLVKQILTQSWRYHFYKVMTKFSQIYYSKLVLGLVVILSIMSNTLFSLGYIIVLCLIMYENDRFLSVEKARKSLVPLFRNFVMPYMILEMFCQLLYQLPIEAFDPKPNQAHDWVWYLA